MVCSVHGICDLDQQSITKAMPKSDELGAAVFLGGQDMVMVKLGVGQL